MIGKLTGTFGGTTADGTIVIEVGGVGYVARVPLFAVESLKAQGIISLFIHTSVKEDALDLYGFPTEEELMFFKQLMSVSGIGPKTAIGILNVSDIGSLKSTIAQGDAAALTKIFGVGKKSAERIVVELRDKIALEVRATPGVSGGDMEVMEALLALGYSASEARSAIKGVRTGTVNERVSAALKALGSNALTS